MEKINYDDFKKEYLLEIEQLLKQRGSATRPVILGEGLSLEKITLELGDKICHVIDIHEVYSAYCKNEYPKFYIAKQTLECFRDFGLVKRTQVESMDNVIICVANLKKSKGPLEKSKIPYLVIDDMAVYFRFNYEMRYGSTMESIVYNNHLLGWDCSAEMLFNIVNQSTAQEIGACALNWVELPEDLNFGHSQVVVKAQDLSSEPYDLIGINGAGTMLYPAVLREFLTAYRERMLIIPYSERKAALFPENCIKETWVQKKIRENIENTEPNLLLSNHVYMYDGGKLSRQYDNLEQMLSALNRDNLTIHKKQGR